MNKEFTLYQEALALKELGFNEHCLASYFHAGKRLHITEYINHGEYTVLAPTFSQAFRFFREKYDLFGVVEGRGYDHKRYYIYSTNGKWHPSHPSFDKPEEAELACLKQLIEIVKEKQNEQQ